LIGKQLCRRRHAARPNDRSTIAPSERVPNNARRDDSPLGLHLGPWVRRRTSALRANALNNLLQCGNGFDLIQIFRSPDSLEDGVVRMRAAFLLCSVALIFPAQAAETISYTYDAKGRLVKVVRTGTVNSNVTYQYVHDKANNRKKVKVTNSPNPPPPS
jgi:hypothetical protein